jgi:hypothetical protein
MKASIFAKAAMAVVLSAGAAQAQLAGTLNFSGTVLARSATLPGGGLDPVNVVLDFINPVGSGMGFITISAGGNTGSFAPFNTIAPAPPVFGTIKDITVGDGGAYNIPGFVQVPVAPLFSFNLLSIAPGSFSSASCFVPAVAGQTCTPAGNSGPTVFNLANNANPASIGGIDATVAFGVSGVVTGPGGPSTFFGTFTTKFPGQSYQDVLTVINTVGGTVQTSFSATLIVTPSTVPEPATVALMGTGLLGLVGFARLRRKA